MEALSYWTVVIWCTYTAAQCWPWLHTVYQCTLRLVTGCKALTHHCILYARVKRPSLALPRLTHWHIFNYNSILNLLPPYHRGYISQRTSNYPLRLNDTSLLSVPRVGKQAFVFPAPAAWKLDLIPIKPFTNVVKGLEANQMGI